MSAIDDFLHAKTDKERRKAGAAIDRGLTIARARGGSTASMTIQQFVRWFEQNYQMVVKACDRGDDEVLCNGNGTNPGEARNVMEEIRDHMDLVPEFVAARKRKS